MYENFASSLHSLRIILNLLNSRNIVGNLRARLGLSTERAGPVDCGFCQRGHLSHLSVLVFAVHHPSFFGSRKLRNRRLTTIMTVCRYTSHCLSCLIIQVSPHLQMFSICRRCKEFTFRSRLSTLFRHGRVQNLHRSWIDIVHVCNFSIGVHLSRLYNKCPTCFMTTRQVLFTITSFSFSADWSASS
jgi:hypothetical protein